VIDVVLLVEGRGGNMMAVVPPGICKLTIISVVGNHLFFCYFEASWVTHSARESENTFSILTTKRRIAVTSRNWRPHLSKNSNICGHIQQLINKIKSTGLIY